MTPAALSAIPRELPALLARIPEFLAPDEARALSEAARTYAGRGAILEITPAADPTGYDQAIRDWRTPLRLLLILDPNPAAADRAYDDWAHWIAGGGLLALRSDTLHHRALATGKFRELTPAGGLHILQRIAACN
ncbi:hypothetical protein ACWDUL_35580 [Nocardia niigatensis]